ncbi:hypothetical protein JCM10212_007046 [Sporobolomyces blumeae]
MGVPGFLRRVVEQGHAIYASALGAVLYRAAEGALDPPKDQPPLNLPLGSPGEWHAVVDVANIAVPVKQTMERQRWRFDHDPAAAFAAFSKRVHLGLARLVASFDKVFNMPCFTLLVDGPLRPCDKEGELKKRARAVALAEIREEVAHEKKARRRERKLKKSATRRWRLSGKQDDFTWNSPADPLPPVRPKARSEVELGDFTIPETFDASLPGWSYIPDLSRIRFALARVEADGSYDDAAHLSPRDSLTSTSIERVVPGSDGLDLPPSPSGFARPPERTILHSSDSDAFAVTSSSSYHWLVEPVRVSRPTYDLAALAPSAGSPPLDPLPTNPGAMAPCYRLVDFVGALHDRDLLPLDTPRGIAGFFVWVGNDYSPGIAGFGVRGLDKKPDAVAFLDRPIPERDSDEWSTYVAEYDQVVPRPRNAPGGDPMPFETFDRLRRITLGEVDDVIDKGQFLSEHIASERVKLREEIKSDLEVASSQAARIGAGGSSPRNFRELPRACWPSPVALEPGTTSTSGTNASNDAPGPGPSRSTTDLGDRSGPKAPRSCTIGPDKKPLPFKRTKVDELLDTLDMSVRVIDEHDLRLPAPLVPVETKTGGGRSLSRELGARMFTVESRLETSIRIFEGPTIRPALMNVLQALALPSCLEAAAVARVLDRALLLCASEYPHLLLDIDLTSLSMNHLVETVSRAVINAGRGSLESVAMEAAKFDTKLTGESYTAPDPRRRLSDTLSPFVTACVETLPRRVLPSVAAERLAHAVLASPDTVAAFIAKAWSKLFPECDLNHPEPPSPLVRSIWFLAKDDVPLRRTIRDYLLSGKVPVWTPSDSISELPPPVSLPPDVRIAIELALEQGLATAGPTTTGATAPSLADLPTALKLLEETLALWARIVPLVAVHFYAVSLARELDVKISAAVEPPTTLRTSARQRTINNNRLAARTGHDRVRSAIENELRPDDILQIALHAEHLPKGGDVSDSSRRRALGFFLLGAANGLKINFEPFAFTCSGTTIPYLTTPADRQTTPPALVVLQDFARNQAEAIERFERAHAQLGEANPDPRLLPNVGPTAAADDPLHKYTPSALAHSFLSTKRESSPGPPPTKGRSSRRSRRSHDYLSTSERYARALARTLPGYLVPANLASNPFFRFSKRTFDAVKDATPRPQYVPYELDEESFRTSCSTVSQLIGTAFLPEGSRSDRVEITRLLRHEVINLFFKIDHSHNALPHLFKIKGDMMDITYLDPRNVTCLPQQLVGCRMTELVEWSYSSILDAYAKFHPRRVKISPILSRHKLTGSVNPKATETSDPADLDPDLARGHVEGREAGGGSRSRGSARTVRDDGVESEEDPQDGTGRRKDQDRNTKATRKEYELCWDRARAVYSDSSPLVSTGAYRPVLALDLPYNDSDKSYCVVSTLEETAVFDRNFAVFQHAMAPFIASPPALPSIATSSLTSSSPSQTDTLIPRAREDNFEPDASPSTVLEVGVVPRGPSPSSVSSLSSASETAFPLQAMEEDGLAVNDGPNEPSSSNSVRIVITVDAGEVATAALCSLTLDGASRTVLSDVVRRNRFAGEQRLESKTTKELANQDGSDARDTVFGHLVSGVVGPENDKFKHATGARLAVERFNDKASTEDQIPQSLTRPTPTADAFTRESRARKDRDRQRLASSFVKSLVAEHGDRDIEVSFVLGGETLPQSGSHSGPTNSNVFVKSILDALVSVKNVTVTVFRMQEFLTSQTCPKCFGPDIAHPTTIETGVPVLRVSHCLSCGILGHRDRWASEVMLVNSVLAAMTGIHPLSPDNEHDTFKRAREPRSLDNEARREIDPAKSTLLRYKQAKYLYDQNQAFGTPSFKCSVYDGDGNQVPDAEPVKPAPKKQNEAVPRAPETLVQAKKKSKAGDAYAGLWALQAV